MAGRFLNKLLGRSPAVPSEVGPALDELARLAEERPSLAGPAGVLCDLLPLLIDKAVSIGVPAVTPDQAADKLAASLPLLQGETLSLDERALSRRWQRVGEVLCRRNQDEAAQALGDAVRAGRLRPAEWLQRVLAGQAADVSALAASLGLDTGLAGTVLRLTCFPSLSSIQESLGTLRAATRWRAGYCLVCGSWPLLGEFRGLEQTRFLRCGLCAAEWEFPRLCCPFCGERDHRALGYFHLDNEEPRYRAATCDTCRGYVKMVTTLTAMSGVRLLVADLATLHLDLVAAERGYLPPA